MFRTYLPDTETSRAADRVHSAKASHIRLEGEFVMGRSPTGAWLTMYHAPRFDVNAAAAVYQTLLNTGAAAAWTGPRA